MNTTLTGRFDDVDKTKTAREEMFGFGIPREKVHIDEDEKQIKVIVPEEQAPQIRDILEKHGIDVAQ